MNDMKRKKLRATKPLKQLKKEIDVLCKKIKHQLEGDVIYENYTSDDIMGFFGVDTST